MVPIGYLLLMLTVREFGDFYKDALALLGEEGYAELVAYIAINPEAGDVIRGSGGFRKLKISSSRYGQKRGRANDLFFLCT